MARKTRTLWQVRIEPRHLSRGAGDMAGFLDMLRYDQCTVETWGINDSHDASAFVVTLAYAPGSWPTLERWHSFSLFPKEVA